MDYKAHDSDVEMTDAEVRRLNLGSQLYRALWVVFVSVGIVSFGAIAGELLSDSGYLGAEHTAVLEKSINFVKSVIRFLWPLLLVSMPAIYVLAFGRNSIALLPTWSLIWIPISIAYGHSLLTAALFDSGIFGIDESVPPRWELFIFGGRYAPYAISIALKGAALDVVESFQISLPQPSPSRELLFFRGLEFVFRTLYSAWGALVLLKVYALFRSRSRSR